MKRYIECEYVNVCDEEIDKKNKNKKRICSCCEEKIDELEKTYEFIKIDLIPYLDNINKNIFNENFDFSSLLNISCHYKYQENNIESEIIFILLPYIDKIKKEFDLEILNNSLN